MTAVLSAAARAAHVEVDGHPHIYADAAAGPLLATLPWPVLDFHRGASHEPVLMAARVTATTRAAFLADVWAADRRRQVVILGAGLDGSAYTWPVDAATSVFEVDLPGVVAWKAAAVGAAGLRTPADVHHVGVDLGAEPLAPALLAAGLDPTAPTLVGWLGCAMYLTPAAVRATLVEVAGLASDVILVMEYLLPPELRDAAGTAYATAVGQMAREHGEPWLSAFSPDEADALLADAGFGAPRQDVRHVPARNWVPEGVWARTDGLAPAGLGMLAVATTGGTRAP